MKIIDNFCDQEVFNDIRNIILNHNFPFYLNDFVAAPGEEEPWCWYGIHRLYDDNVPLGEFPHLIPMLTEQIRIFAPEYRIRGLIRIKINFYPHTETLKEHPPHVDLDYKHHAAILSLNTCNGFTRLEDGTKVDSVANRMLFFDGSISHNSSTTTNQMGRWNINFNFL